MPEHSGTYRPYRPSNGTEGDIFMAEWCEKCELHNHSDFDAPCMIQLRALAHSISEPEYPAEWNYTNGGAPQCTAFTTGEPEDPRCERTIDMFAANHTGKGEWR
jgi:hypothetical protein